MVGSRGIPARYSGIEKALEELCPRLVQRGHQVTIYARPNASCNQSFFKGVRIRSLPAINTKHLETFSRVLLSLLLEMGEDNDIVHFHALGPAVFSYIPRLYSSKTVVTIQGLDWQRKKWGWAARLFLKGGEYASATFPNATIVVSKVLKKYYDTKYHVQTTYIPNGVSIPSLKKPNLINKYGLTPKKYLFFASRLVPEKGCHYLIEAFKKLETNMKLIIAGSSSHTDTYLRQLQASSKEHPNILFTGFVSGDLLAELFSNAYLYVLPSEIEGLSLSLLEAMSYGLCAVTSDIPENIGVTQNRFGYSFRNKDVDDLAEKLTCLLQQPDQVWAVGQESRKHVSEHYNWDCITDQTEAVYRSLYG